MTWVQFINACSDKTDVCELYLHGARLTFLDGLGSGLTNTENRKDLKEFRNQCELFLKKQLGTQTNSNDTKLRVESDENRFGIPPFYINLGNAQANRPIFTFNAPTTTFNTMRVLRGMQLNKAILLEGSPGVGKTSLITSLAAHSRHQIYRVNLSDQTDISDLFGADLPVEGGSGGQFAWRDGPLLQALKKGYWILLDELNLASQSVLEGLNACLDHRGEIFIPELGKTFHVKTGTRFFACQNPLKQGGSRRGLPQSFLNRFIQVYVSPLSDEDLQMILWTQFQALPSEILDKMLHFNRRILKEINSYSFGQKGSPWEFNLRDLTRWCQAVIYQFENNTEKTYQPERLVNLIYGDRMRSLEDKKRIEVIFQECFGYEVKGDAPILYVTSNRVYLGDIALIKHQNGVDLAVVDQSKDCLVLRSQLGVLRSLAYCVNLNWMTLLVSRLREKIIMHEIFCWPTGRRFRCRKEFYSAYFSNFGRKVFESSTGHVRNGYYRYPWWL